MLFIIVFRCSTGNGRKMSCTREIIHLQHCRITYSEAQILYTHVTQKDMSLSLYLYRIFDHCLYTPLLWKIIDKENKSTYRSKETYKKQTRVNKTCLLSRSTSLTKEQEEREEKRPQTSWLRLHFLVIISHFILLTTSNASWL